MYNDILGKKEGRWPIHDDNGIDWIKHAIEVRSKQFKRIQNFIEKQYDIEFIINKSQKYESKGKSKANGIITNFIIQLLKEYKEIFDFINEEFSDCLMDFNNETTSEVVIHLLKMAIEYQKEVCSRCTYKNDKINDAIAALYPAYHNEDEKLEDFVIETMKLGIRTRRKKMKEKYILKEMNEC